MLLALAATSQLSCATSGASGRVVRTQGEKYSVVGTADSRADALVAALDEAGEFCEDRKKEAVFDQDFLNEAYRDGSTEGIDLSELPVIGSALSNDRREQLLLDFSCA